MHNELAALLEEQACFGEGTLEWLTVQEEINDLLQKNQIFC